MAAQRHYHLIGIGGTAMGSLAGLLKEAGHRVTGSDEGVYPPMSTLLDELGIDYVEGYAATNLEPTPDIVVVGNAISRGNPELEAVLNRKLRYTSAAATIKEEFIQGRHSLAVAGTHGKTTTTTLLAWILDVGGLDPSFLIGGVAENFGTSFRLTDSDYFVIEADEYDTAYFDKGPKMWHYLPDTGVVTNIEFDHADIYRDQEAYHFAFSRFINLIPSRGTLVAGWDSPAVRELAGASLAPVASFGLEGDADWTATDIGYDTAITRFRVLRRGAPWAEVEMPLAGAYNVLNALAAIVAAASVGVPAGAVEEALRSVKPPRRRMELLGEPRGITVIDDFAHHPTAVRASIQAARQRYGGRRLLAVFEPRSYTAQRREFQDDYREALAAADAAIVAGLFHPERYGRDTGMDPHALVAALRDDTEWAEHIPDPDAIVTTLLERARSGDVILIMSNGGFGGLHGKLLSALEP